MDTGSLRQLVESCGGDFHAAHTADEALQRAAAEPWRLIMVNRILDQTGESGIELLSRLKTSASADVLLISNFADAQRQAEQAGAIAGFGKAEIGEPLVAEQLRQLFNTSVDAG